MHRANVSAIHLCQRCPRLLAYQLRGRKNLWKVGLAGSGRLPGTLFHDRIAAPFHVLMASGAKTPVSQRLQTLLRGPDDRLEIGILATLEDHFFIPAMKRYGKTLQAEQIVQLGRGLELWCRHLARFLRLIRSAQPEPRNAMLTPYFHHPEVLLEATYPLEDGRKLRVSGKYDALWFDPNTGEAVVVEFKGRRAERVDEDLVQLALYCWLLYTVTGVTPRGVVLYLEEEDPEVAYSAAGLQHAMQHFPHLFQQVIEVKETVRHKSRMALPAAPDPRLCTVCPFEARCDQDWGPRRDIRCTRFDEGDKIPPASPLRKGKTKGDVRDGENESEAEAGLQALVKALGDLKLPVAGLGHLAGPRFIRFKINPKLKQGVTVRKLINQAENLQVALGLQVAPLIQPQAGYVSVDVPRKIRIPLTLGEVWRQGQRHHPDSRVAFPLGMAIDGTIVWADLSDPAMTSILVGGTSGSGKSVCLRAAVIGMALHATPAEVQLTLIDPKRVSFTDLACLPHLAAPIVMDAEPAVARLTQLVEEMEQRYHLFAARGVPDITAYNQRASPLPHHVVLIDEYADLMLDKETRMQLEVAVQRLGQKGRAAGMHLILATQRPDARVVTPLIKANLQLKIALKVTTASNSSVILDQTGAEYLIGHGDMLVGGSVPLQRLQGPLVTKTEIDLAMQNR